MELGLLINVLVVASYISSLKQRAPPMVRIGITSSFPGLGSSMGGDFCAKVNLGLNDVPGSTGG